MTTILQPDQYGEIGRKEELVPVPGTDAHIRLLEPTSFDRDKYQSWLFDKDGNIKPESRELIIPRLLTIVIVNEEDKPMFKFSNKKHLEILGALPGTFTDVLMEKASALMGMPGANGEVNPIDEAEGN